jgi:di/tricarboxylate transporter
MAEDDVLLVLGDAETVARLATERNLAVWEHIDDDGAVVETLFNRSSGLAEVVIPVRSKLIGRTVFTGMVARDGDLMVLGVQRGGEDLGPQPIALAAGDHLLLQGTWQALDKHLADPQMLVVNSPDVVRRQALAPGPGAREALIILAVLIVLLATNAVPAAIVGILCAGAMIVSGVLTLPQAYKEIDWNTCILIGGMFPLAAAMTTSGAAKLIADGLVGTVGEAGPLALLIGLILITATLTHFITNISTVLVIWPVALAAAAEMGVSPRPLLMGVTVAAAAAFLTPFCSPPNLMVYGPGGYRFGDYWKFGVPCLVWFLVVAIVFVPLYWRF